ncbi:MAG: bifunctional riboflavin kinase/FAD synthetase [Calditrichaeota bacterium]|nr:bifunctional riboflavin kinase/FAD synthetase [Candidatus Cloacimonadota bacterium]MCB1046161.1 bifunctional riboflavin kinase/FAD synthetase [Calditrichota bacterium]MCB9473045.1 bifunctional riboflavin kinase/FAD synthetase [Candidatus Delongbacteria bacterium]
MSAPLDVITIGSFDGVHLGHRALLERVRERASEVGGRSGVVTFSPHPRQVLNPDGAPALLCSDEEKLQLLRDCGLDRVVVLEFTADLAALNAEQFIQRLLLPEVGFSHLVIGHDHGFGRGRSGNATTLQELSPRLGFDLEVLPPVEILGGPVSSTRIRHSLALGEIQLAATLLGRPIVLKGRVVSGHGRGKGLGFPTANLALAPEHGLLPRSGVYAVLALLDGERMPAMMNLGPRPTFGETSLVPEIHILDRQVELNGRELGVELVEFVRDIARFESVAELMTQLARDRERIQGRFAR